MKCSICGKEITGFGNNPWPVRRAEDARCCDECDNLFVIPARIVSMNLPKENFQRFSEAIDKEDYKTLLKLFLTPEERKAREKMI